MSAAGRRLERMPAGRTTRHPQDAPAALVERRFLRRLREFANDPGRCMPSLFGLWRFLRWVFMIPLAALRSSEQRFLDRCMPEPNSGCWLWVGKQNGVYGLLRFGDRFQMAHRVSYRLFCGEIPDGMQVNHRCDFPICVNPDHLWLGSQADNMRDCREKGRMPHGEERPIHKITAAQADEIYRRILSGETQKSLAATFGIKKQSVQAIVYGRSWCRVTGVPRNPQPRRGRRLDCGSSAGGCG